MVVNAFDSILCYLGNQDGQDLVEYAVLVLFLSVAVVVVLPEVAIPIVAFYEGIAAQIP